MFVVLVYVCVLVPLLPPQFFFFFSVGVGLGWGVVKPILLR